MSQLGLRFKTEEEFNSFFNTLIRIVPADQLPSEVLLEESELAHIRGNAWQAPNRVIYFRNRKDWEAAKAMQQLLAPIEKRLAALESLTVAQVGEPPGRDSL